MTDTSKRPNRQTSPAWSDRTHVPAPGQAASACTHGEPTQGTPIQPRVHTPASPRAPPV